MKLIQQGLFRLAKDKNIDTLYEVWISDGGEQEILVDVWQINDRNTNEYKHYETHSIQYFMKQEFEKVDVPYKVKDSYMYLHLYSKKSRNGQKLIDKNKFSKKISKTFPYDFSKIIQDYDIFKSGNKIIIKYKGKDKGCKPEFGPVKPIIKKELENGKI